MRMLLLLATLVLLPWAGHTQHQKLEFQTILGTAHYFGDLNPNDRLPVFAQTKPAAGLAFRYVPTPAFGLRASILTGILAGSDASLKLPNPIRFVDFETRFLQTHLMLEYEPFAKRRTPATGGYKKLISPFLCFGVGYSGYQVAADYSKTPRGGIFEQVQADRNTQNPKGGWVLPAGGGIKLDLSKKTSLSLEGHMQPANHDRLDGVSISGTQNNNDWYAFLGFSLIKRIGKYDYDRDLIFDEVDNCPRIAGTQSAKGCPDADFDGIEDLEDGCPTLAGTIEHYGCPDTDNDNVPDQKDLCPLVAGIDTLSGCPDTDADGIADHEDKCPNDKGVKEERGCPIPDEDKDGIPDKLDKCPKIPGVSEEEGCPFPDKDKDGIHDKIDACPNESGTTALQGCPDADGDAVADHEDKCPSTPGLDSLNGCPQMAATDKETIDFAFNHILFSTAKATLLASSYKTLDKIAVILNTYPDIQLFISGHTDSNGDAESNRKLSDRRAKACYDYLTKKGIKADRLTSQGFGEENPKTDNTTESGRQVNRRVEFSIK